MTTNTSPQILRPAGRASVRRRGTVTSLRGIPAATWLAAMAPHPRPGDRLPAA
jgi:hypothetical protein